MNTQEKAEKYAYALTEALRFVDAVREALRRVETAGSRHNSVHATAKRASMDLSRALIELRK